MFLVVKWKQLDFSGLKLRPTLFFYGNSNFALAGTIGALPFLQNFQPYQNGLPAPGTCPSFVATPLMIIVLVGLCSQKERNSAFIFCIDRRHNHSCEKKDYLVEMQHSAYFLDH